MPPNTVYVGRPTKWGNPYKLTDRAATVKAYEIWLRERLREDPHFLDELKGKDLACWCPLVDKNGKPVSCHADIIIKIMKERGIA